MTSKPPPCAWCESPAMREATIEPAIYGSVRDPNTGRSAKVLKRKAIKRKAITAWVCADHDEMVKRNYAEQEARRKAERKRREALWKKRAA